MADVNPFAAQDNPWADDGGAPAPASAASAPSSASAPAPVPAPAPSPFGQEPLPSDNVPSWDQGSAPSQSSTAGATLGAGQPPPKAGQPEVGCCRSCLNGFVACCGGCNHAVASQWWILAIILGIVAAGLLAIFGSAFAFYDPIIRAGHCPSVDCSSSSFDCTAVDPGCAVLLTKISENQCTCKAPCSDSSWSEYRPVSFSVKLTTDGKRGNLFCPWPSRNFDWRVSASSIGPSFLIFVIVALFKGWSSYLWVLGTGVFGLGGVFFYVFASDTGALLTAQTECHNNYKTIADVNPALDLKCEYAFAVWTVLGSTAACVLLGWTGILLCLHGRHYASSRAAAMAAAQPPPAAPAGAGAPSAPAGSYEPPTDNPFETGRKY
ncbi:unnamed protein product [Symbiodinium sp. KB8]|nr:unnamed protein product [Symbiodinium sp. KB8]